MKVLVAEDDPNMLAAILDILATDGHVGIGAKDGLEALAKFDECDPDFVCLDIMMPGMNGYEVCHLIRTKNERVPIFFLSAKSDEIDKVVGLELGADDYMVKPFGMREFLARIRAIGRRLSKELEIPATDVFEIGDLAVSRTELRARRGDEAIDLTPRELRILEVLAENENAALTRERVFAECWGGTLFPGSRALDQTIAQLRKKVELDPRNPTIIRTVRGVGYRYDGPS